MKLPESSFAIALFVFQILLLGLYAGYVDYKSGVSISDTQAFYPRKYIFIIISSQLLLFIFSLSQQINYSEHYADRV